MKLFSNFDTQLKQEAVDEAILEFGPEKVVVLTKSSLFLFYKVVFPVVWWTSLFIFLEILPYWALEDLGPVVHIFSVFILILYLFFLYKPLKYYLDYKMDFSIVTPRLLTRYNQSWLMRRDIQTSNVRNIKTISIKKHNFLYNLFDNGDLIFLSEWDRFDQWEIILHYIFDPEERKKEITSVMKLLSSD